MFKKAISNIRNARPNLIYTISIMSIILILGLIVLKAVYSMTGLVSIINRYTAVQLLIFLYTTCSFIFMMIYILVIEKGISLRERNFRIHCNRKLRNFIGGAVLGGIIMMVMISILMLFGSIYLNKSILSYNVHYGLATIISLFFIWAINSFLLEFMVRGWMYDILSRRYNARCAVLTSSLIACFYTLMRGDATLLGCINIFLINVLLSLLAYIKGNIYVTTGMNTTLHWMQIQVFGFNIPGMRSGYSFFRFSPSGSNFINGGHFGPMSGIVATVLISVAILFTVIINERKMLQLMEQPSTE